MLRLATTMSVVDSGLAAAILPDFERQNGCRVDVIAVGTGQALSIAGRGDADVVIVHARKQEEEFLAAGHAKQRYEIMFNDFVLVGPAGDPARAGAGKSAADAFRAIAAARATFFSRGDKSGTHTKELAIWSAAGLAPDKDAGWYQSLGLGTREVLLAANEKQAYTLTDRGTWLATPGQAAGVAHRLRGRPSPSQQGPGIDQPLCRDGRRPGGSPRRQRGVGRAVRGVVAVAGDPAEDRAVRRQPVRSAAVLSCRPLTGRDVPRN